MDVHLHTFTLFQLRIDIHSSQPLCMLHRTTYIALVHLNICIQNINKYKYVFVYKFNNIEANICLGIEISENVGALSAIKHKL